MRGAFTFTLCLLVAISDVTSQEVNLQCTTDVCDVWLSKNECVKIDEECLETGRVFTYPVECGCCDYCIKYIEEGEYCSMGQAGQPTAGSICGSGLGCQEDEGDDHATCKRLDTKCHRAQDDYENHKKNGTLGHLMQKPLCDEYGDYDPVVCIPGSICYCVSPAGDRIFGESVFDSPTVQFTMTCKCSRDAWRASKLMLGSDASYSHCLLDGSYDPLQCVDNICTCVDRNGIPDSSRVHVSLINDTNPSCFDRELGHVSHTWLRECEATRANLLAIQRHLVQDGATHVLTEMPGCGLDGRYDRTQTRDDLLVCADPNGEVISAGSTLFQSDRYSPLAAFVNCNCARTRDTLLRAAESSEISPKIPDCCDNGNFPAWQCSRGLCYCTDSHGNQLYQEVSEEDVSQLPCYMDDPCTILIATPFK